MKFSTRAIHAGQEPDAATGAIMTPIFQTSTYAQTGLGGHKGYEYSRTGNPTRTALEECLAALENGSYGLAFASGLAGESAILSMLKAGDHIVSCDDLYGGTYRLFERIVGRYNIETSYVTASSIADYEKAIRPNTKLLWLETPTNPLLRLVDIRAVAEIAHRHQILVVVDNTFSSPYFQKPLDLGADIVLHSTTKYINGHSDVVGGAIITNNQEAYEALKFNQNAAGGIPGPFDAWLTLRGVKTLAVRMRQHEENALAVARYLVEHPRVEKVYYPGLPSHPDHELAKRQMSGFGGMVSFQFKGTLADVDRVVRRLKIFTFAESLGGVESLVCHPATMTHASIPQKIREARGLTDTLLRLSVGIEDAEDLLADLEYALA
ncbi:cystathionine gamma-synthase [Ktedonosporobacter rubrisoli]|uniref:Cystathionine gamma-synthase n=1 Tax=Ktedonosporobacter rubrisoli TaxID=2509675 RepID=A0A4P6JU41_KTERU|nr:cystathionine gamma-synthase [Ktedonosporobacter rubrisoli]QBD79139.1 cystathionine gamma-synthase [Ktedonosporobacter rubrisoli]